MVAIGYVIAVGVVAATGFFASWGAAIALAVVFTLPSIVVFLPAYYLAYGVVALIPGANPSTASGSGTVAADGTVTSVVVGDSPAWFTVLTHLMGTCALVAAALVNVLLWQRVAHYRRKRAEVGDGGV